MSNPERAPHGPENAEQPHNKQEHVDDRPEQKAELSPESHAEHEEKIENARNEAAHEAISGREVSQGEHKTKDSDSSEPVHRNRKESYEHTMKSVQSEMSAPARVFSRVIHNPVVERTSEVIGSTVARPDAILSGAIASCVLVLSVYLLARYNGFELRGSETIIAFVIGWIIGLVFDFLRTLITGKRQ